MAKQVIETRFVTTGANKVVSDTQKIGKEQTRLGQASASAGRQFSSQAAGLGGVVGVYAAAAANIFALTAAFTALNRAAQFETIIRGTEAFANSLGVTANSVIGSIKQITNGQLTIIESAEQANLALSAGFNTEQISELADVANKASKALGRNLTDAFQRITRGAIKLEPELLDEIGIFTRIDPAVQAYATSVGKAASQLTQFERRQAFVNKVIEDGQKAFSDIDTSILSTQEKFEQLITNFSDLALVVGSFVANSLVPFVDLLNKNVGNELLLLGTIGLLVFNRLRVGLVSFATEGLAAGSSALSRFADRLTAAKVNAAGLTSQFKAAAAEFKGSGAFLGAGRASGAELKRQIATGALTTQQALFAQKEIGTLLENEKGQREALNKNIKAGVISQAEFKKQTDQSEQRTRALTSTQKAVDAQLKSSSIGAKSLATGLNLASRAGAVLASTLSKAFFGLNLIVGVLATGQFLLSFFDIDLFGEIGRLIKSIGQESRDTRAGIDSLTESVKSNEGAFEELATQLGLTGEQFQQALGSELIKKSQDEIDRLVTSLQIRLKKLQEAQAKSGTLIGADVISSAGPRESRGLTTEGFLSNTIDREKLAERIIEIETELERLSNVSVVVESDIQFLGSAITKLSEASGVAAKAFSILVGSQNLIVDSQDNIIFKFGEFSQILATNVDGTVKLTEENTNFANSIAVAKQQLELLRRGLTDGSLTGDKLDKVLGVLRMSLKNAGVAIEDLTEGQREAEAALTSFSENSVSALDKLASEIILIENLTDRLAKKSGAAFSAIDDAVLTGLISQSGEIAKTDKERAANQAQLLADQKAQLAALEATLGTARQQEGIETKIKVLKEQIAISEKVALGNQILTTKVAEEQRKAQAKVLKTQERQSDIVEAQVKQAEEQLTRLEEELFFRKEIAKLTVNLDIAKSFFKVDEARLENLSQELSLAQELGSLEEDRIQNSARLNRITLERVQALETASREAGFADSRELIQRALDNPRTTERETIRLRQELAQLEALNQRSSILAQTELLNQQKEDDLASIARQKNLLDLEFSKQETLIKSRLDIFDKESDLLTKQQDLEIRKARLEKRRAENAVLDIEGGKTVELLRAKVAADEKRDALALIQADAELLKQKVQFNKEAVSDQTQLLKGEADLLFAETGKRVQIADPAKANTKATNELIDSLAKQADLIDETLKKQLNLIETNAEKSGASATSEAEIAKLKLDNLKEQVLKEAELRGIQRGSILAELEGAGLILTAKKDNLTVEEQIIRENFAKKLEALGIERDTIDQLLEFARQRAEFELSFQKRFDDALAGSANTIESKAISSLNDLNTAFIEGTLTFDLAKNKFSEFAGSLIRDIQKIFFQETIAKPAAGFLKDTFLGSEEGGGGIFGKLFGMKASGGYVRQMAAGGMMRDRVPALLEPGEFVVRKQAAKVAGAGNLAALNATGQMGGGNVSVNVTNTGTPQEATASPPRFDGEKMVIDIVMRDLSNNGPIRKTLRAGGAG